MNWENLEKQSCEVDISSVKSLCAFNLDIDYVVKILDTSKLGIFKSMKNIVKGVSNPKEFAFALHKSMFEGKGFEEVCQDPKLFAWVYSHFGEPNEKRIGGQAGLISNQLSFLGQDVILYSPGLSKYAGSLLNSKIKIPAVEKNGKLSFKKVSDSTAKSQVNWIFEFEKGLKINNFMTARANRFILSSKNTFNPDFDVSLKTKLPELGSLLDVCFISGYHHAPLDCTFNEEKHSIKLLKSKNKKLTLHYEYVKSKNYNVLSMLSQFDSLGCDEVEVKQLLELLGEDKQVKKMNDLDSNVLFDSAMLLKDKLKVKRLHVHNLGYAINIYDSKPTLDHVKGMLFASSVTNTRAKYGKFVTFKKQHAFCLEEGLSDLGYKAIASFYRKNPSLGSKFLETGVGDNFILVPLHVVEKPMYTVGLGDTISSVSLSAEIALKKQPMYKSTLF